jgi:hypothetical protein
VDLPLWRAPHKKNDRLGILLSEISLLYMSEVSVQIKSIYRNRDFIINIFHKLRQVSSVLVFLGATEGDAWKGEVTLLRVNLEPKEGPGSQVFLQENRDQA